MKNNLKTFPEIILDDPFPDDLYDCVEWKKRFEAELLELLKEADLSTIEKMWYWKGKEDLVEEIRGLEEAEK